MEATKIESIKAEYERLFADIQGEENIIFTKAEYYCYKHFTSSNIMADTAFILFRRKEGRKLHTYGKWAQIVGKIGYAEVVYCDYVQDWRALIEPGKVDEILKKLQSMGYVASVQTLTKDGYLYKREKEEFYKYSKK